MINQFLQNAYDRTEINSFFNQPSPIPPSMPSLIICQDKLVKQNKQIQEYNLLSSKNQNQNQDNFANINYSELSKNNLNEINNECLLPMNVKSHNNAPELQKGFSANIDVDSELKRINHYDDKCFYDNYKVNPKKFNGCFKEIFEKQDQGLNYMKGMVNYNLNINLDPQNNCVDPIKFPQCPQENNNPVPKNHSRGLNNNTNQNVEYQFSNHKFIGGFECQKLFNNFTKRTTYRNNSSN